MEVDPATRAVILIEERLRHIQEASDNRDKAVGRIETVVNGQQSQINQVVTDMAVLKSQHASFWKGIAIMFGALSLIGGAIGWVVSEYTSAVSHNAAVSGK